jgi:serine/threonine protein kinase
MGKVKLAKHITTQETVAIKFIQKQHINTEEMGNKVSREIDILKLLHHPNLVQLYEV